MHEPSPMWLQQTDLSQTQFPAWRKQVSDFDSNKDPGHVPPRTYPGYPTWPLFAPRFPSLFFLSAALLRRRSAPHLRTHLLSQKTLGRMLWHAHAAHPGHETGMGPTPSAGGLNALELYLIVLDPDSNQSTWLPGGVYHYDRMAHRLAQLSEGASRQIWQACVPAMQLRPGGSLLWVIVGDGARVTAKYGQRGLRFLLLEAGHLMQNLCLVSVAEKSCTVPLGGFFEDEIATHLQLLRSDHVLYIGLFG